MKLYKFVIHDIRHGLIRYKYLLAIPIFLLSCFLCRIRLCGEPCGVLGYFIFLFKGSLPLRFIQSASEFEIPAFWILTLNGCLFIHFDYFLKDLSHNGLQLIIRSGKKHIWFLSKCIWNFMSCMLYFVIAFLTITVFSFITEQNVSVTITQEALKMMLIELQENLPVLIPSDAILIAIILPFLTVFAFSILEMVGCLFVKPILSFIGCLCLQIMSIFMEYAFILGNGAMVIRSNLIITDGIPPYIAAVFTIVVIVSAIIIGSWKFERCDILDAEE